MSADDPHQEYGTVRLPLSGAPVVAPTDGGIRFRKVRGFGGRSEAAFNAGEHVLGRRAGPPALVAADHDRAVSSRHARIFVRGEEWWIEDLGSLNGTFVDNAPIGTAEARLTAGAVVELGRGDGSVAFVVTGGAVERCPAPVGVVPVEPESREVRERDSGRIGWIDDLRGLVARGVDHLSNAVARKRLALRLQDLELRAAKARAAAEIPLSELGAAALRADPGLTSKCGEAAAVLAAVDEANGLRAQSDELRRRIEAASPTGDLDDEPRRAARTEAAAALARADGAVREARTALGVAEAAARGSAERVAKGLSEVVAASAAVGGAPAGTSVEWVAAIERLFRAMPEAIAGADAAAVPLREAAEGRRVAAAALDVVERRRAECEQAVRTLREADDREAERRRAERAELESALKASLSRIEAAEARIVSAYAEMGRAVFRSRLTSAVELPQFGPAKAALAAALAADVERDKAAAELRALEF